MMNPCICLFLLFSISTVQSVYGEDGPVVQLPGGKVRGLVEMVDSSHKVHFFQGIKFGKALHWS